MNTVRPVCLVIVTVLLAGCSKSQKDEAADAAKKAEAARMTAIVMAIKDVDEGKAASATITNTAVAAIKNSDITWNGTTFGLFPIVEGASKKVLRKRLEKVVPSLFQALKDKDRFVAAHVILTQMLDNDYPSSAAEWKGLQVALYADGKTEIPVEQRAGLVRQWEDWWSANVEWFSRIDRFNHVVLKEMVGKQVRLVGDLEGLRNKGDGALRTTNGLVWMNTSLEIRSTDSTTNVVVEGVLEYQEAWTVAEDFDAKSVQTDLEPGQEVPERYLLRDPKIVRAQ
jgi:hypothetical protein